MGRYYTRQVVFDDRSLRKKLSVTFVVREELLQDINIAFKAQHIQYVCNICLVAISV